MDAGSDEAESGPRELTAPIPPVLPDRDREHLSLLAVFHWVFAGLSLLSLLFLVVHYLVMRGMMSNPDFWEQGQNSPGGAPFNPADFFAWFQLFYLFAGIALLAQVVLNILSAVYLRRSRHRRFSQVVAGLDCLSMPLGTILGVFTLIVLGRDSVRRRYADER